MQIVGTPWSPRLRQPLESRPSRIPGRRTAVYLKESFKSSAGISWRENDMRTNEIIGSRETGARMSRARRYQDLSISSWAD
jgi:hypothetical protein